jgi:hypothetical protein
VFIIGIITTIITEDIAMDMDVHGMDVFLSGGETIDINRRPFRRI